MDSLGRFTLGEELGSGPYTTTYDARDGDERCVVKLVNDEAVPTNESRRAGLVEALAGLKGIEHPSAVRVLDAGEVDGKLFVASEYMGCPTLEKHLAERGPLDEQQVVLFVRQTAQALDKAHDTGYCHGALVPANVFVVSPEKVKLSDFAIASLVQEPPDVADMDGQGGDAGAANDEWVTAEDLLRTKTGKSVVAREEDDMVALAALMLNMLGIQTPPRTEGEDLETYRQALLESGYSQASAPESGVGVHTVEVMRRLLTAGGFDSPGEVVVELASAMLLGRTFGRARTAPAPAPAAGAETAQVHPEEPAPAPQAPAFPVSGDLSALEFKGDPRSAAYTPFFIWTDRRGGRFVVLHDGERLAIGRDPDMADWTLMDPAISRRHCYLIKDGDKITVEDAGSSNGTFVNDERIQTTEISPTDVVRVGTTRLFMSVPARD
jgi:hypothetical protein